jgi:hypothetical protein
LEPPYFFGFGGSHKLLILKDLMAIHSRFSSAFHQTSHIL